MSTADPVARAHAMRELIESQADAVDAGCTMTEPLVEAFDANNLFRLLVPAELGGYEADVPTIADVCEAIAYADGSVGWAYAQNIVVMSYAAYIDPDLAQDYANIRAAAGMFAPIGTAVRQNGGYRVSGQYQFGSGSGHADYIGGGAIVMDGEEMVMRDNGMPEMVAYVVPANNARLQGNWDVMGLRGTGSYDFEIPAQDIDAGMVFPLFDAPTRTGGKLFGLGGLTLGTISSAAWAVGVARRAMDEIVSIAKAGRARLGSLPLAEQQIFQRGLGEHQTAVKAARMLLVDEYSAGVEEIAAGDPQRVQRQDRAMKAAASYTIEVCKHATRFAWESSGSAGIRNPSVLQRCYRDMCVGGGHQVFDARNFDDLVKESLGQAQPLF